MFFMAFRAAFLSFLFIYNYSYAESPVSIDVVYTWVDGSDEKWSAERSKWMKTEGLLTEGPAIDHNTRMSRFRDRGELKYSLRSIYKFVPFVRKIFIVTNGQVPKWLKAHPKVKIITHDEIFLDKKHLPTFNSMAIETHLHRIPGLGEYYVYLNDDFFFGRGAKISDFYTESGRIKLRFSSGVVPTALPIPGESGWASATKNTNLLLNGLYRHTKRHHVAHTPYPMVKSFVEKMEKKFSHIFQLVSSHRFRSIHDYTITNGILPYMALELRKGYRVHSECITVSYGKNLKREREKIKEIRKKRPLFFCIQDSAIELSDDRLKYLQSFFECYFPDRAPWEKVVEAE